MLSFKFIQDKNLESKPLSPALHIISTPIGNMDDISLRALNAIISVDFLYTEDPRVSLKLLNHFNIKRSLRTYNDQANDKVRTEIINLIKSGKSIGLISDAGTPLISDPGYKLTKDIEFNNLDIFSLPGACSPIAALTCSSMPTDNFSFLGFAPRKTAQLESLFEKVKHIQTPLIFFESANRINNFLEVAAHKMPNQEIFIARELSKKFEEKISTTTDKARKIIADRILKGELVIIINNQLQKKTIAFANDLNKVIEIGNKYLSAKDLSKFLSEITNLKKNEIYNNILEKEKAV